MESNPTEPKKIGRPKIVRKDVTDLTENPLSVGTVDMKKKELHQKINMHRVIKEDWKRFENELKKAHELIKQSAIEMEVFKDAAEKAEKDVLDAMMSLKDDWGRDQRIWYTVKITSITTDGSFSWIFFDHKVFNDFLGIMIDKGYAEHMKIEPSYVLLDKNEACTLIMYAQNMEAPDVLSNACDCFYFFFKMNEKAEPLRRLKSRLSLIITSGEDDIEKMIRDTLDDFEIETTEPKDVDDKIKKIGKRLAEIEKLKNETARKNNNNNNFNTK